MADPERTLLSMEPACLPYQIWNFAGKVHPTIPEISVGVVRVVVRA
jgi:hypothetical protein